jgi:quercetin dioxygenase-like cupin family protein
MDNPAIVRAVAADDDCFGERRQIGDYFVRFKVGAGETGGNFFVAENVFPAKGRPGRHVHPYQDEWFYVREGEFIFEIGDQRNRRLA